MRQRSHAPVCEKPQRLQLEVLESREVPAIAIQIDYSLDSNGFFSDPTRRALLESAANTVAAQINANLPGIIPAGGNNWSETIFNPANGQQISIPNPVVGANTLVVYVGGRAIGGVEAGFGGSGGYSASGAQEWLNFLAARGPGGSLLWGGSITFDTGTDWFFGNAISGIGTNQVDFLSVVEHELGHVLGIGTSPKWFSQSSGGSFFGPAADAMYGGPVPESSDGAHWGDGVTIGGVHAALDPILQRGTRVTFSSLDYAGLTDLGWSLGGPTTITSPPPVTTPTPPVISSEALGVAPVPVGSPLLHMVSAGSTPTSRLVALTGATDGSAQIFSMGAGGTLTAAGPAFDPFPGYTGVIRSTIADFNGDGTADFAFATGSGVSATLRVISGATGKDLVAPTGIFDGFTGGVFLAAGDVDRDGRAELAVSADTGGGPRVSLYKVQNGALADVLNFIAFNSPNFRGGSRVAMADVNKDGACDLIVGAGTGGGPRVSVYDGTALLSGNLNHLVPDFFALDPSLRSGVFVTSADVNGDGYADVIYSTGNTGGPRIRIVSGYQLVTNPGEDVASAPALADFFALNSNDRNGIRVAARDVDGDGKAEIIVGSGSTTEASLRVIPLSQAGNPTNPVFNPFNSPATIDGIYVG